MRAEPPKAEHRVQMCQTEGMTGACSPTDSTTLRNQGCGNLSHGRLHVAAHAGAALAEILMPRGAGSRQISPTHSLATFGAEAGTHWQKPPCSPARDPWSGVGEEEHSGTCVWDWRSAPRSIRLADLPFPAAVRRWHCYCRRSASAALPCPPPASEVVARPAETTAVAPKRRSTAERRNHASGLRPHLKRGKRG